MTPILQIMIGIGIGILGYFLIRPRPIQNTNMRSKNNDFLSAPGDNCPICLEKMENFNMRYLKCSHALHQKCYNDLKKTSDLCPLCRKKM